MFRGRTSKLCKISSGVLLLFLVASLSLTKATTPLAIPFTVAWDASPTPNVAGYALYYGAVDSSVTNRLEMGTTRQITLRNFYTQTNYFFFVVAYDGNGIESDPSDSLVVTPSLISPIQVTRLGDGTMRIQFQTAAGSNCRVEHSSLNTPGQWQTLAGAVADSSGWVTVDDAPETRPSVRFYRAALP